MKRNFDDDIDEKIKNYLINEAKDISAPDNMFFKIRAGILKENEGGFFNMKIGFLKVKTALVAVALCAVTTASVGAATGKFYWSGSSSPLNDMKSFPTVDTVKEKLGFTPKYVESFDGGYKFDTFNFSNDKLMSDDTHTVVLKTKSAGFKYKKDGSEDNQDLVMSAQKIDEENFSSGEEDDKLDVSEYNGVKIYYHNFKYKAVPENYTATKEEEEQVKEGTLQIGYGSDEIIEDNMQSVSWYDDGIGYNILNTNYDEVSKDGMINMAKTVIDK